MKNENLGHVFVKAESEGNTIILMFHCIESASEVAQMLCDHCPFPVKATVLSVEDNDDEHE